MPPFTLPSILVWILNHIAILFISLSPRWELVDPSSPWFLGSLLKGSSSFSSRSTVSKPQLTKLRIVSTFLKDGKNQRIYGRDNMPPAKPNLLPGPFKKISLLTPPLYILGRKEIRTQFSKLSPQAVPSGMEVGGDSSPVTQCEVRR